MGYISSCGPFMHLLGGYQVFSKDTILSLIIPITKNHFAVRTLFRFVKIASWDNEIFSLDVDDITVQTVMFDYNNDNLTGNLCGYPNPKWLTAIKNINYLLNHTVSELTLKFSTNLNQNASDESWGIKDLLVTYYTCFVGCDICTGPTNADCNRCVNTFVSVDGKCLKCDANCQTCSENTTHCESCYSDNSYKYLANNHTCVQKCPSFQYPDNAICTNCSILDHCLECANSTHCLTCDNTSKNHFYHFTFSIIALCFNETQCYSFKGYYPNPTSIYNHFYLKLIFY